MILYVLGAPGSGKSTLCTHLRSRSNGTVVFDWDGLQEAAGQLAQAPIPATVRTWGPYRSLIRAVVDQVGAVDMILFGVCTPDELAGWPIDRWLLLDCSDQERRARLHSRDAAPAVEALADARAYRRLDLPVVDTTARPVEEVAREIQAYLDAERGTTS